MKDISWHNIPWEKAINTLNSNHQTGLSETEVALRRKEFGANKLPGEKPLSRLRILIEQFRSPLIYILLFAGVITIIFREYTDAVVIMAAVALNTVVGYFQETKANEALQELKKVLSINAIVYRDGQKKEISVEDLVPGDIVVLRSGDKVPTDGRLIESHDLKINESALTGEWLAANKTTSVLPENTTLADRDNLVYMGTAIEEGHGLAIVTGTGIATEIGRITSLVRETKEAKTPYQVKISKFSRSLGIIIGIICIIIFLQGILKGGEFIEMFTTAVAVAVASIPEGLPIAMTVILALGMQRILKRKGLVRKLAAAETLGNTSIIATDKTGTLTEAKMSVAGIYTFNESHDSAKVVLQNALLCSDAFIENPDAKPEEWEIRGQATEIALIKAGVNYGLLKDDLETIEPQIDQVPFSSVYKYSASLRQVPEELDHGHQMIYVKGAPEVILSRTTHWQQQDKTVTIDATKKQFLVDKYEELTGLGYRVLGVASREIPIGTSDSLKDLITDLTFVGFIFLEDPIRKEAKAAMQTCFEAGMRPIIITGDHRLTAKAVANKLGLDVTDKNILEGKDLESMSDKELQKKLPSIQIYARVEPKHKLRIVEAWQKRGEIVAMTGDGINDAPALKQANIGVALGSGTEVAKSVADLVLLTDDFSIIVAAVEEGRAILDNIRKVVLYLLTYSFTEIFLVSASILLGWPLPVTAVQILWINLIEDGLPAIALAFEPKEANLMANKPQSHDLPLLTRDMKIIIATVGIITNALLFGLYLLLLNNGGNSLEYIRTIIFAGLTITALNYVFSCKSLTHNIWNIDFLNNKILLGSWAIGLVSLVAGIHLPILNTLLGTVPLDWKAWALIVGLGAINTLLVETVKHYLIVSHRSKK